MGLNKYKIGNLIELVTETNADLKYTADDAMGMTITKEIIPTKADLNGTDLSKFIVVHPNEFIYNPRTHGKKIGFGYNRVNINFIISWNNIAFRIKRDKLNTILPDYLFLHFKRDEWDREACYQSWGTSTEVFTWEALCEMELLLPDLPTQQKYVDIYNAMVANQQSYEHGLEDLKLVCDSSIDKLTNCYRMVGDFIEKNQKKNKDRKFTKAEVKGFNNDGQFIKPMRLFSGDVAKCTVLQKNDFVYNLRVNSTIERLSIAINESSDLIVSPDYESFYVVKDDELYPYYLYMLLQRDSFAKKVLYVSLGSSTTYFRFNNLCEINIPVPEYSKQVDIATVYRTYKERWTINEKLKAQIKDICPILIKGSLEEGQ